MVRNVAEGVPLPRVVRKKKRFLTHEQVGQLAEACAPYETLIRVLAYAGLRWGEAAALRVHRVDLLRRRLEVDEAHTEVGGHVVEGTTKNHHRRSVPIPRFLADELAEHLVGKNPAASLAVQAGANVKLVQQMLGHASAAMSLDVYAGLFADNLDEVADRLDQAFTNLNADQLRTEPGPRPGTPHPMR